MQIPAARQAHTGGDSEQQTWECDSGPITAQLYYLPSLLSHTDRRQQDRQRDQQLQTD